MAEGTPGGPRSYGTGMKLVGLMLGYALLLAANGRSRAVPYGETSQQSPTRVVAPGRRPGDGGQPGGNATVAPPGKRFLLLFDDYDGDGTPDLLAIDEGGRVLTYLTHGKDGVGGWYSDSGDDPNVALFDYGTAEDGEAATSCGTGKIRLNEVVEGSKPNFSEQVVVYPTEYINVMKATNTDGRPLYRIFGTEGSDLWVTDGDNDGFLDMIYWNEKCVVPLKGGPLTDFLFWDFVDSPEGEKVPNLQRYSGISLLSDGDEIQEKTE